MPLGAWAEVGADPEQVVVGLVPGVGDDPFERLEEEHEPGATGVDEAVLKGSGAHGVLTAGTVVQVVVGPEADMIADDINDLL